LDEVIKPDLWEEWIKAKKTWFPRTDTLENRAYDKRTPGKPYLKRVTFYVKLYFSLETIFSHFEYIFIVI